MKLVSKGRQQIPAWKKKSNYPYVVARVGAMRSRLIPREQYSKLLQMSLPEIARFVEESEYKREIDELAVRFSGIDLLELALNLNLSRTFKKILGFSEGEIALLVSSYLKRWDAWSIKSIIRGKHYKASTDEILQTIIPAGDLHLDFLVSLARLDTVEDVIERLKIKRSVFYGPMAMSKREFYETKNLAVLEDAIDRTYFSAVMDDITLEKGFVTGLLPDLSKYTALSNIFTGRSLRVFAEFLRTEIDMVNLRTLFRLKRENLEGEEIEKYLIEGGMRLTGAQLSELADVKSFEEFLDKLRGTYYGKELGEAIEAIESTGSLNAVEIELEKILMRTAQIISYEFPLSIAPVLWFLIRKNAEVYNLRVIVRGKETNLSTDAIKKQMVLWNA